MPDADETERKRYLKNKPVKVVFYINVISILNYLN